MLYVPGDVLHVYAGDALSDADADACVDVCHLGAWGGPANEATRGILAVLVAARHTHSGVAEMDHYAGLIVSVAVVVDCG